MLFVGNFVFKVFPETHCRVGGNCGFVWVFPIMFIAKWFGRVCLLGTASYKQTYVFVYN